MITVPRATVAGRMRLLVAVRVCVLVGVRVAMHHVSMPVLVLVHVAVSVLMLLRRIGGELLFHDNLRAISCRTLYSHRPTRGTGACAGSYGRAAGPCVAGN